MLKTGFEGSCDCGAGGIATEEGRSNVKGDVV